MHSAIVRGDILLSAIYNESHQKLRWTDEHTREFGHVIKQIQQSVHVAGMRTLATIV